MRPAQSGTSSTTRVQSTSSSTPRGRVATARTNQGTAVDPANVYWCTMENLTENTSGGYAAQCLGTDFIEVNGNWPGGSDPTNDYAVVKLSGSPGVGWFAIATAADSTIDNDEDNSAGYARRTVVRRQRSPIAAASETRPVSRDRSCVFRMTSRSGLATTRSPSARWSFRPTTPSPPRCISIRPPVRPWRPACPNHGKLRPETSWTRVGPPGIGMCPTRVRSRRPICPSA